MITPSLAAGLAQLQALANFIDQGSSNATFVFYDDAKPTSVAIAAVDAAKLVALELPKPSLLSVNADGISLNPTDSGTVVKSGTAVWARLFNGSGLAVADFSVGTDIILNSAAMVLGGTVTMSAITFRSPT